MNTKTTPIEVLALRDLIANQRVTIRYWMGQVAERNAIIKQLREDKEKLLDALAIVDVKGANMIFTIQTDDEVAGLDITQALSDAGISHTIVSKQDKAQNAELLEVLGEITDAVLRFDWEEDSEIGLSFAKARAIIATVKGANHG